MSVKLLGLTFDAVGSVLIGFAALRVHHRFLNEHKVDNKVFKSMRREQVLGVLGIILVSAGYFLQAISS